MDRFSNNPPFRSKYDPDSNNPLHIGSTIGCDLCDDNKAVFESPKVKFCWCVDCDKEVRKEHELTEDDVDYI